MYPHLCGTLVDWKVDAFGGLSSEKGSLDESIAELDFTLKWKLLRSVTYRVVCLVLEACTIRSAANLAPAIFRADGPSSSSARAPNTNIRGCPHHRSRSTIGYPQKLLTGSLSFCIKDGGRLPKPVANRIRSTSIEVPNDRCNEQASFAVDWERLDTPAWCHWICLFLIAYCSPLLTAAVTVPGIRSSEIICRRCMRQLVSRKV